MSGNAIRHFGQLLRYRWYYPRSGRPSLQRIEPASLRSLPRSHQSLPAKSSYVTPCFQSLLPYPLQPASLPLRNSPCGCCRTPPCVCCCALLLFEGPTCGGVTVLPRFNSFRPPPAAAYGLASLSLLTTVRTPLSRPPPIRQKQQGQPIHARSNVRANMNVLPRSQRVKSVYTYIKESGYRRWRHCQRQDFFLNLHFRKRYSNSCLSSPFEIPLRLRCPTPTPSQTMPLYLPNTRFSDCWSSAGNVTFYHRDGKCYWRKRSRQEYAGTPAQLDTAEIHHRAILAWQSLSSEEQMTWRRNAESVPAKRPPFDKDNHISGYNLFVSSYHGHALLGNEHIPEPQSMVMFPDFDLIYDNAEIADGNLVLRCKSQIRGDSERFRVLGKIVVTSPGKGCKTSHLRNYLADGGVFVLPIPEGMENKREFQIHIRYLLVDSVTGFRCQYKKDSFLVAVE